MTANPWEVTWQPGHGIAVVGPAFVLLADHLGQQRRDLLWSLCRSNDIPVHQVLLALGADGLAELPGFALVHSASRRAFVRGLGTVEPTGGSVWSAPEVSTWSEHPLPDGIHDLALRLGPTTHDSELLPVSASVLHASSLRIRVDENVGAHDDEAQVAEEPVSDVVAAHPPRAESVVIREVPTERAAESAPAQETISEPVEVAYDALFGDSIARRPEEAAVRPPEIEEPPVDARESTDPTDGTGAVVIGDDSDHMTIAGQSRRDLVRQRSTGVTADDPEPRGVRASLTLADGRVYELDRAVFIGRSPEAFGTSLDQLPQLVTVDSPHHDVSRTHAKFRRDGDDVLVCDVSSNGTILLRPGRAPERLAPRIDTLLSDGCALDLGDGIRVDVTIERRK